jgi:hypothetical protein
LPAKKVFSFDCFSLVVESENQVSHYFGFARREFQGPGIVGLSFLVKFLFKKQVGDYFKFLIFIIE